MICKWCGAQQERPGRPCSRCGKEPPALSRCGGFYDLTEFPRPEAPKKKNSAALWLLGAACVLLAAALLAAVLMNQGLQKENNELKAQLQTTAQQ